MRTIGSLAVLFGLAFLFAPAHAQGPRVDSESAKVERQLSPALPSRIPDDVVVSCNIDPVVYRTVFESCVAAGEEAGFSGPQWTRWCRESAREIACKPLVVALPDRLVGRPATDNPFAAIIRGGGLRVIAPETSRGAGEPEACRGPRPRNLGCSQICKPCITFVCEGGEWKREPIDFPDEICEPQEPIGTPSATACPRSDTGFCPAECSICF